MSNLEGRDPKRMADDEHFHRGDEKLRPRLLNFWQKSGSAR